MTSLALTPSDFMDMASGMRKIQDAVNNLYAWSSLTLAPASQSLFSATVFAALTGFPIAAGDTIEVEAWVYKATGNSGRVWLSADATTGYAFGNLSTGADELRVIGAGSALWTNASSTFTGRHHARFVFNVVATNNIYAWGESDASRPTAAVHDTTTNIVGANALVYLETDDATKCSLRYRKIVSNIFNL